MSKLKWNQICLLSAGMLLIFSYQNCAKQSFNESQAIADAKAYQSETNLPQVEVISPVNAPVVVTQPQQGPVPAQATLVGQQPQAQVPVPAASCVASGVAPYQSFSLRGTGYQFCATNPEEIRGIQANLIIDSNADVMFAYKSLASMCCSQRMLVTKVAPGCMDGIFAAVCM